MPREIELAVLMLDADTLHLRSPAGHYAALPRHRIEPNLLSELEQALQAPPVPHADHAALFRRAVSLNVRIDDSDDRLAPAVLEILGIVGPALGDAGELPRCFSGLRRFQSSPLYFALECRDDYTLW